jgi:hypothetical protein
MNQLLVQVEEGGPRPCGEEGKVQLKCGDGRKLFTWLLWGAPLSEGRALIAYLIGREIKPLWDVWCFLLLPDAAELMKNRSARGDTVAIPLP